MGITLTTAFGIWNASAGANVINQLEYQTYTDFSGLPSGQGEMHWDCFKPNLTNSTGLKGDQDGMYFFYDYDQNTTCARDALFAWAKWNCQTLGIKGFRLDAVTLSCRLCG
jgi:alpha-amylase